MTNDEINRAVAEELGWVRHPLSDDHWVRPGNSLCVPDFCTDYNAAAEMRKAIAEDEQNSFARYLCDIAFTGNEDCRSAHYWSAINTTLTSKPRHSSSCEGSGKS